MATINEYGRLKVRRLLFPKASPPAEIEVDINTKHLIIKLLCPECPAYIQRDFTRKNLQPYELAVNCMTSSDYLYDVTEINRSGKRIIKGLDQVADNTVPESDTCVVLLVYIEFND